MPEFTVKIEAPELTAALNQLADAFGGKLVQSAPIAPTAPLPAVPVATQPPVAPPASIPVATQPPVAPPASIPMATQPPAAPPPTVPTAPPPAYTIEQLLAAGGQLMDKGPQAVQQLQGLLAKYAVMKVSDLQPAQYGAFATDLRGLGAQI